MLAAFGGLFSVMLRFSCSRLIGFWLALLLASHAHAQQTPSAKLDRERELKAVEQSMAASSQAKAAMAKEIETLTADREALQASLIETGERVRAAEERIATAKTGFDKASETEAAVRRSLAERSDLIADVLASLQRMGRSPPPALVIQPDDALAAVRAAILMGSVLPDMQNELAVIVKDLEQLAAARERQQREGDAIETERTAIVADKMRLAALVEARQRVILEKERHLEHEQTRALALAAQAQSLKELIAGISSAQSDAARVEEASRLVPPPSGNGLGGNAQAAVAPRIPFESLRGRLILPVAGEEIAGYGSPDGFGGNTDGVTISTPVQAIITAPVDAIVAFAGPFRRSGQLLILDVGQNYHMVLSGMERISVRTDQFVLAGEPLAVMGDRRLSGFATDVTSSVNEPGADADGPALYVELRKNREPIDSKSWWASTQD
jgi:murein hydrolase activator